MPGGRRIYYGWYVLAVAALGGLLSAGSSQFMMGVLLPAITAETGWSHSVVSGALLLGTLTAGVVSPLAGSVQDRRGPRLLTALAGVVLAAGFALLGLGASVAAFYAGYALARGAAQGVLGGAAQRAIAVRWFTRRRGRAMGIVSMSVPLGSAVLALIAQWSLAQGHGWRTVFAAMAVLTLVLLVLPAWLVLRASPEAIGLRPDGDPAPRPGSAARRAAAEPLWALRDALRTPALRLIFAGSALAVAANGALVFYLVSFLVERGVGSVPAAAAASALALAGAAANLVWGMLAERVSERGLAVAAQLLAALVVPGLLLVHEAGPAVAYAALIGLVVRGEGSVIHLVLVGYFGRAVFGRLSGVLGSVQIVALGFGPVAASAVYDLTGSFTLLFALLGVLYAAAAVLYALARRPLPPQDAFTPLA